MKENVCVIGGGPSGIIAAGFAGEKNNVTIFEKNEKLGKKLFITGKGRCNITNSEDISQFFDSVIHNKEFMYSGFYSFSNLEIISLLENYGLEVKIERGGRVFPKSDKSSDVLKAFSKFLKDKKVKISLNNKVESVKKTSKGFEVITSKGDFIFDKVIIATGGASYPTTGSTGDGYKFAKDLGHTIVDLRPSLVPMETNLKYTKELQGLSLKNVELCVKDNSKNKFVHKEFGEMIFTHYGISGPIVLSISKYFHDLGLYSLYLDLKPALDEGQLDLRILKDFNKYNNKNFKNALDDLLPKKIIDPIIDISKIDPSKPVHQITKDERLRLVNIIKTFPLKVTALRSIEEAIVTSGGVSTSEINPSTMESKIIPGLYFAGEIVDVDGLTGGYNLQIAYSTGFLAGSNL